MGPERRRILMYSHDTFGLGHLTRTLRIADAIQHRHQNTSILVLSGLPVAPYLPLPPRTDLLKIPSVLKFGADLYRSRDLDIDFKQVRAMRRGVIRSTAETFQPHVFLVDNVPQGMKNEILPTLEYLNGKAHVVLNLRDILDDGEVIRRSWEKGGVYETLEEHYGAIHVFGDESIYDAVKEYDLPVATTRQLGYVTPGSRRRGPHHLSDPPRVLVTAGGGGDGLPFLEATLGGVVQIAGQVGFDVELVTGPLMAESARRILASQAKAAGARITEFARDLPTRIERSDLVVAMAGYNTCCEILTCANSALLYPRSVPRVEQKLRAEAFGRRGLARSLSTGAPDPTEIAEAIREMIEQSDCLDEGSLPRLDGQHRAAKALDPWLGDPRQLRARDARSSVGGDASLFLERRRTPVGIEKAVAAVRSHFDISTFWPGAVVS